jgi:hypothetical protein
MLNELKLQSSQNYESLTKAHDTAKQLVKAVIHGHVENLELFGDNGVGKTVLTKNTLEEEGLREGAGYLFCSSHITVPAIISKLEKCVEDTSWTGNTIVVFDDASWIQSTQPKEQAFAKSLLSSDKDGYAEYSTANGDHRIPLKKLRFILIYNGYKKSSSVHFDAIHDRLVSYEFNFSVHEKLLLTKKLMIDTEENQEQQRLKKILFNSITDQIMISGETKYSLRTFHKLYQVAQTSYTLAEDILSIDYKTNEHFRRFINIFESSLINVSDKPQKFIDATNLSRKTYFNYRNKYLQLRDIKSLKYTRLTDNLSSIEHTPIEDFSSSDIPF